MDQFLAEHFGTKTASAQDDSAQNQVELFQKLAGDNGIDLESMTEAQISYLWNQTFSKTASEEGDEGKDKESEGEDDKKEEAKKEHEEKKEAMAKMAEAEFLGKVMAHSLVSELRKIASADEESDEDKTAGATEIGMKLREGAKTVGKHLKDAATAKTLREGLGAKKNVGSALGASMAGRHAMQNAPKGARDAMQKAVLTEAGDAAKKKIQSGALKTTALYGGGATAAGAATYAATRKKKDSKEASALDELGAKNAIEKAAEAGFDIDEAVERISAVFTLGLGESEKVASATDVDTAVEVRGLEFLEAAGYPVTWES